MTITLKSVLSEVATLVPVATNLIEVVAGLGIIPGAGPALALIEQLAPIAASLVTKIEGIRDQTEADYPEVWAGVRADWMTALAKWNNLQGG